MNKHANRRGFLATAGGLAVTMPLAGLCDGLSAGEGSAEDAQGRAGAPLVIARQGSFAARTR